MTREPTDGLIERLAREARPVKPLAPPLLRAALWIGAVAAAFAAVVAVTGAGGEVWARLSSSLYAAELFATFLTGVAAVVAATAWSIPGRSPLWTLLPLPAALVWIGAAGLRCALGAAHAESLLANWNCFVFITSTSVPLSLALIVFLRRAAAVNLLQVTALGGLGIAALGAALLQFFHPDEPTLVDLASHAAAIVVVVTAMTTIGRRVLAQSLR